MEKHPTKGGKILEFNNYCVETRDLIRKRAAEILKVESVFSLQVHFADHQYWVHNDHTGSWYSVVEDSGGLGAGIALEQIDESGDTPNRPILPPEGYRFLKEGEIMNVPGDLFWKFPGKWESRSPEDWPFSSSYRPVARKIGVASISPDRDPNI